MDPRHIVMTGQLATPQEVNAHLQACDVYLQPSLWDGMPNALLEAYFRRRAAAAGVDWDALRAAAPDPTPIFSTRTW